MRFSPKTTTLILVGMVVAIGAIVYFVTLSK
jgi:hypothetical protein